MDATPIKIKIGAVDETGPAFKSAVAGLGAVEAKGLDVGKVLRQLAGPASVAGIVLLGKNALAAADQIDDMSEKLGISAETLSQYRYVASQTGADLEGIGKGIKLAAKNIGEASSGNKQLAADFNALGLSVSALRAMQPAEAFEAIGGAIAALPEDSDRTAAAMALLGKSGADLIPMFQRGSEAIAEMRAESDRLGATLSNEAAAKAGIANDAIDGLKLAFSGAASAVVVELAPAIVSLTELMQPAAAGVAKLAGPLSWLVEKMQLLRAGYSVDYSDLTAKQWAAVDNVLRDHGRTAAATFALKTAAENRAWSLSSELIAAETAARAGFTQQIKEGGAAHNKALAAQEIAERAAAEAAKKTTATKKELAAAVGWTATEYQRLTAAAAEYAGENERLAQLAGGKRGSELEAKREGIAADLAAKEAAKELGAASSEAFTTAEMAARSAADSIVSGFTAAVFEGRRQLFDLRSAAQSIFSMLASYGVRWGISALFPVLAPVMGIVPGKAAGADKAGPVTMPAGGASGAPIALTVNVSGVVDVTNPLSARRLAEAIYDELGRVGKTHGPTSAGVAL